MAKTNYCLSINYLLISLCKIERKRLDEAFYCRRQLLLSRGIDKRLIKLSPVLNRRFGGFRLRIKIGKSNTSCQSSLIVKSQEEIDLRGS